MQHRTLIIATKEGKTSVHQTLRLGIITRIGREGLMRKGYSFLEDIFFFFFLPSEHKMEPEET